MKANQPAETTAVKNNPWITLIACAAAILPLVYLSLVWNSLPGRLPMHYDLNGQVDRYGSRTELLTTVALLSGMSVGLMLLFQALPRLDPKKNLKFSLRALQMIGLGTCLLLTTVSISLVRMALSNDPRAVFNILPFAVLGFFALMGNYLTSLRPNYFAGIRTPWTLESESVWRKTHRLGGKLLFWGSLALLPVLVLLPGGVPRLLVVMVALAICLGYTVYYSYRVYRDEHVEPSHSA
jgi:uncharacterized membrane protein